MRFWRRGMPEEGAPDPDAIRPEAAEVAKYFLQCPSLSVKFRA